MAFVPPLPGSIEMIWVVILWYTPNTYSEFRFDQNALTFTGGAFPVYCVNAIRLFNKFYNGWKEDPKKFIININSRNRFRVGDGSFGDNQYAAVKAHLHQQWVDVLHDTGRLCKISNISPGFVDTNLISHFSMPEWLKQPPEECAETIVWLINQPDNVEIGELSYWRRKVE